MNCQECIRLMNEILKLVLASYELSLIQVEEFLHLMYADVMDLITLNNGTGSKLQGRYLFVKREVPREDPGIFRLVRPYCKIDGREKKIICIREKEYKGNTKNRSIFISINELTRADIEAIKSIKVKNLTGWYLLERSHISSSSSDDSVFGNMRPVLQVSADPNTRPDIRRIKAFPIIREEIPLSARKLLNEFKVMTFDCESDNGRWISRDFISQPPNWAWWLYYKSEGSEKISKTDGTIICTIRLLGHTISSATDNKIIYLDLPYRKVRRTDARLTLLYKS